VKFTGNFRFPATDAITPMGFAQCEGLGLADGHDDLDLTAKGNLVTNIR
jgi:hypothetical protein